MIHPHQPAVKVCLAAVLLAGVGSLQAANAQPQRLALIVTRVVDGHGEALEGVQVSLIRCMGVRRYTQVPSFELANRTGVPFEPDRDGCQAEREETDDDGNARFLNVHVGSTRIEAGRGSTITYLLRATKDGYTRARRLVTPHVARNDVKLVLYRTAGERMFELVAEAEAAAAEQDFASAEAAMIQSVAMMRAEIAVRGVDVPDVLLEALQYLAYLQLRAGNDIAATSTLDELLLLAPDDPYALRVSGVIAVQNRDWEVAEAQFRSYLLFHPDDSDAHLMMGNFMLETGELDAAVKYLESAVDLDEENVMAYRSLGLAYEQAGRLRDAAATLERYLALAGNPNDAVQIRATIAMLRR